MSSSGKTPKSTQQSLFDDETGRGEKPEFASEHEVAISRTRKSAKPKQAAKRQRPGETDVNAASSGSRPISLSEAHEVYLPVREVAKRFGVSVQTVWRWKKDWADFPKPIEITAGTTRWRLSDLVEFERKLGSKA
ncbi:helix-turn-helix transcriptional regulator [Mesorhizobium sp. ASY16-5R]|uniref:helix-turn-helix transcriptional regulator n=1 Tax=Mesorhizobium sp. ASY16-5R TaxID=3445772 RepID=UPI003F9FC894